MIVQRRDKTLGGGWRLGRLLPTVAAAVVAVVAGVTRAPGAGDGAGGPIIRERIRLGEAELVCARPNAIAPLEPARFTLRGAEGRVPDAVAVAVADGGGAVYRTMTAGAVDGMIAFQFLPGGRPGEHRVEIATGEAKAVIRVVMTKVDTAIATPGDGRVGAFFDGLKRVILKEIRTIPFDGKVYYENKEWLRDHIHILKATRYWRLTGEPPILDPRTPLELWIRLQYPDGLYPEIVVGMADPHVTYTRPEYVTPIEGGRAVIRLEAENDIEFLMAQAIWQAWKATGDDAWLVTPLKGALSPLVSIDKALRHIVGDTGRRWDAGLGLSVRGVSCDTWDWVYGQKGRDANRRIESDTPMAVFYGDNTGLYQAFVQVAEMQRAVGRNEARAREWEKRAEELKTALMKQAWNGRFFAHMVHTRPTAESAPEAWREDFAADRTRLSLSNAYTLNRGILGQAEASRVIETFLGLRLNPPPAEKGGGPLAHEWVTLFPGYRNVDAILYEPGRYANGALGSFTAGELMRGAYAYGYAGYGADILNRLMALERRDGEIVFMYDQNGEVSERKPLGYDTRTLSLGGGGPAGWGTAAIYEAMVAGLAGVRDADGSFARLTVAPAWEAFGCAEARVTVTFATVDDYFAYCYRHEPERRRVTLHVTGSRRTVLDAAIPVPVGTAPREVRVNGRSLPYGVRTAAVGDLDPHTGKRLTDRRKCAAFQVTTETQTANISVTYK